MYLEKTCRAYIRHMIQAFMIAYTAAACVCKVYARIKWILMQHSVLRDKGAPCVRCVPGLSAAQFKFPCWVPASCPPHTHTHPPTRQNAQTFTQNEGKYVVTQLEHKLNLFSLNAFNTVCVGGWGGWGGLGIYMEWENSKAVKSGAPALSQSIKEWCVHVSGRVHTQTALWQADK